MTRVVFVGSKRTGLNCLERIHQLAPTSLAGVVTFDDSADTRTVLHEFRSFGERSAIPVKLAKNRSDSERLMNDFKPDICLVVGWYWLIGAETLNRVPRGFLGIHNSLFPKYRGGAPLVWSLINGEKEVGFSLFSFTEGMDDGPVWGQRAISLQGDEYIGEVLQRLDAEAVDFLDEIWPAILDGSAEPAQDHAQATFCGLRIPEDGEIDWKRSAREIFNFVRAQSTPYPGAYTSIDGSQKLTIWKARPIDVCFYGTPGQVAQIRPDGVYVICGDNHPLLIEEVGLSGESRRSAHEVLKSLKTRLRPLAFQV